MLKNIHLSKKIIKKPRARSARGFFIIFTQTFHLNSHREEFFRLYECKK